MHTGWSVDNEEQDGVRFLIGMRWGALWRLVHRPWVALAFARMLRARPETGLLRTRLSVRSSGPVVVQRWRSTADLRRWARDRDEAHAAPWHRFRDEVGRTAAWGVWHDVSLPDGQQL
jgi:hypothetical protein